MDCTHSRSRYSVLPTTSTNSSRAAARIRLPLESHFMPRVTPESTESSTKTVMIAMRTICRGRLGSNRPAESRPALICSTPSPSDVATPNIVPASATASIVLPQPPRTRLPSRGSSAQRIEMGRLRRWIA
jgi:hypothetical protein